MEILKDKIKEFLALDTGSGYGRGRADGTGFGSCDGMGCGLGAGVQKTIPAVMVLLFLMEMVGAGVLAKTIVFLQTMTIFLTVKIPLV